MKPKTSELLKFKRLCRRLGESKRGIVGLLELLWTETAKNCPEGDVGRFSNEEIAIMCDWQGDPDELVGALIETRWLDEHTTYRLLIHDWREHAPDYIHGSLRRWGKQFAGHDANGTVPRKILNEAPSLPFLSLPSNSIDQTSERAGECYTEVAIDDTAWGEAASDFNAIAKELNGDKQLKPDDRETIVRGVLVARRCLDSGILGRIRRSLGRMRKKGTLTSPYGYFQKSLIKECEKISVDFHRAAAAFEIPEHLLNPQQARAP